MSVAKEVYQTVLSIAEESAKPNAVAVDESARFPIEAFSALKDAKILATGIPSKLGGAGLNIQEQARLCQTLSERCASSGMILGMHFIKTNSLVEWSDGSDFFREYLSSMLNRPVLIASMTSEEGIGGDLRHSNAALDVQSSVFKLEKSSPCLSYVKEADDILVTCRRDAAASHADQKLVLIRDQQMQREIKGVWNAMGMRGTCSHACQINAEAPITQILEQSFSDIATQTMIPDAHVIWSHIWLGIATDAFNKAKLATRKHFRTDDSQVPNSARKLADLHAQLQLLQHSVDLCSSEYLKAKQSKDLKTLKGLKFSLSINALKLNASRMAQAICLQSLEVCGFSGFLREGDLSVERNIRDVLSASVMVSNERLIDVNSARLLV